MENDDAKVQEIVRDLELQPHPEGGYFKRIYASEHKVDTDKGQR